MPHSGRPDQLLAGPGIDANGIARAAHQIHRAGVPAGWTLLRLDVRVGLVDRARTAIHPPWVTSRLRDRARLGPRTTAVPWVPRYVESGAKRFRRDANCGGGHRP